MFTGIVETTAAILQKTDQGLVLEKPAIFHDLTVGSSISVSGVCLTVTHFDDQSMSFDVIPETWARTKLASLKEGDHVNLERAMKMGDRFDGHMVQGHVEGVATVDSVQRTVDSDVRLTITVPREFLPFIAPKGSIAIDGVSLTVASVQEHQITVALIPETLRVTTLGWLKEGNAVNVETDMLLRGSVNSSQG